MNKRAQKVLQMLKPKVRAFGFNEKEVKSIAVQIADNLTTEEDAPDEDLENEINEKIDSAIPLLKFAQSTASRQVEDYRRQHETDDNNDEDEDDDDPSNSGSKKPGSKKNTKNDETQPSWVKALMEQNEKLSARLDAMESGKTKDKRRAKLEKLLKDTGSFGKSTLRQFDRMSFENDDEFDEFIEGVEEDLKSLNQERADAGLAKLGNPPASQTKGDEAEVEVMSDDDVKALAKR